MRKGEAKRWGVPNLNLSHNAILLGVILSSFSPNPREIETLQDLVTHQDLGEERAGTKD